jgi:hypothetical protein
MQRTQVNRARISERADHAPRINPASTLLLAAPGQSHGFVGRARKSAKLTSTQRNSIGRRSEWSRSPYAPRGGWR